jgi:hypothetical protein
VEERLMPRLTNSPQHTTILELEARKSFSLGLWFKDPAGLPVDLDEATITLVAAKVDPFGNGVAVLDELAALVSPEVGYARLNIQAAALDLPAGSYPMAVTLRASGYSAIVLKGELKILVNPESESVGSVFAGGNPPKSLTVYLREKHDVHVEVGGSLVPADLQVTWDTLVGKPELFPSSWLTMEDTPTEFPPEAHRHDWDELDSVPTIFPSTWLEVEDKPTEFPPEAHTHAWGEVTGKPGSFTPSAHNHAASEITSGELSLARIPNITVANGGTGATTAAGARSNLGAAATSHSHGPSEIDQIIASLGRTVAPSSYPTGISIMNTGAGSLWPTTLASVITVKVSALRMFQIVVGKTSGNIYVRADTDGDDWGALSEINRRDSPHAAYAMAVGSVSVPGGSGSVSSASVTFPSSRFNVSPRVTLGARSSVPETTLKMVSQVVANSSSMTVYVYRTNSTATDVEWVAVQMTSGAANG